MECCFNNVAKYQALILELEITVSMKMKNLKVLRDSKLVINQLLSLYDVRKLELVPYYGYATRLLRLFNDITIEYVYLNEIKQANILANLVSIFSLPNMQEKVLVCHRWVVLSSIDNLVKNKHVNLVFIYKIKKED